MYQVEKASGNPPLSTHTSAPLTLISQGGGIGGGAYVVGVMKALKELGALVYVTRTITSSAGTPAVLYPLLGKDSFAEHVWTQEVTRPEVVNRSVRRFLQGHPLLDIDYLVDEILTQHPFDSDAFHRHVVTMDMSVTSLSKKNTEDGREENCLALENMLLSNRDPYDPLTMIKASIAIPAVYGRIVSVGDGVYVDGGITSQLPHHYAGREAKIVILTEPSRGDFRKSPAEEALLFFCENQGWLQPELRHAIQSRHLLYRAEYARLGQREDQGETIIRLAPKQPLRAGVLCHKPLIVHATIEQGYTETMQEYRKIEAVLQQLELKYAG
jgi:predicted patatin/cPLA2 family phospholipase